MADLPPCDADIFKNGIVVAQVTGPRSTTIEAWIQIVRAACGERVDWRMAGGRGMVLAIGDLAKVDAALSAHRQLLVDMYMDAPDNWIKTPQPADVQLTIYNTRPASWRDVVPHVDEAPDGSLVLIDPTL